MRAQSTTLRRGHLDWATEIINWTPFFNANIQHLFFCIVVWPKILSWVLFVCLASWQIRSILKGISYHCYTDDIQLVVRICCLVCIQHYSLQRALMCPFLASVSGCDDWLVSHLCSHTEILFTHLSHDKLIYSVLPTNWWMQQISDEKSLYQSDVLAVIFFHCHRYMNTRASSYDKQRLHWETSAGSKSTASSNTRDTTIEQ